jgi:glycosyltransferase involved in cell wall biosynthesis
MNQTHSPSRGRLVYATVPKIGGTFNYFRNLRQALAPLGWQVIALTVGRKLNALWDEPFADADCFRLAEQVDDEQEQAKAIVDWLLQRQIDFFIPMSTPAGVSAIPHLPPSILPIYRCSNITRHAYDIVTEHLDRVPRVIATSRRQYDDLRVARRVPQEKLVLIPHATDNTPFDRAFVSRQANTGPIRLAFLGRILDSAKGVMILPAILDHLDRRRVDYTLTLIGDGPDRERLRVRLGESRRVIWLGNQPNDRIPSLLQQADVLLMPSRFEGFGFSLIEAMAAGTVPVVSRIRGVTDWIVDDPATGFVCPIGDASEFADRVARLAGDRPMLAAMSQKTHLAAIERFSLDRLGSDYARLFDELRQAGPPRPPAAPWSAFRPATGFQPTFRRWIPDPWKGIMRGWLERWGWGV